MARIVYYAFPVPGETRGGQKMILRHVESLRELGFNAVCWMKTEAQAQVGMAHNARIVIGAGPQADDILVLPDDARTAITTAAGLPQRTVIFTQNPFTLGTIGLPALEGFPADRFPPFISVGPMLCDVVRRLYPQAEVRLVPCFADERRFRPAVQRNRVIALTPSKRRMEAIFIRQVFRKLHPAHAPRPWRELTNAPEAEVAGAFGQAELFLSLNRLESVGITTLEAMASGCVCAGFVGVGGRDYATPQNGFWVPDDDCMAAVDALATACDLADAGGPALRQRVEAAQETARQWSYARFREALEAAWMELAPDARLRNGPLD